MVSSFAVASTSSGAEKYKRLLSLGSGQASDASSEFQLESSEMFFPISVLGPFGEDAFFCDVQTTYADAARKVSAEQRGKSFIAKEFPDYIVCF